MRLKVLGSSGAEFPGFNPPAFLIDGKILLDAGTIGSMLDEDAQWKLRYILITHAHLDHVKGIPFLADNIIVKNKKHSVTVIGPSEVIRTLKKSLLNDRVWPDFTMLPTEKTPVIKLKTIRPGRPFPVDGYKVTAYGVNHAVPATGYILEDRYGRRLLYTGDTGPTETIWKKAGKRPIDCIIVETSFPNKMKKMALRAGHLTAGLLLKELAKMRHQPRKILITHLKPQYLKEIKAEIGRLGLKNLHILSTGDTFEI